MELARASRTVCPRSCAGTRGNPLDERSGRVAEAAVGCALAPAHRTGPPGYSARKRVKRRYPEAPPRIMRPISASRASTSPEPRAQSVSVV